MMKQHKNELDVEVIGGAAPLTKEEEKAITEFIKASKERQQKQASRQKSRAANRVAQGRFTPTSSRNQT